MLTAKRRLIAAAAMLIGATTLTTACSDNTTATKRNPTQAHVPQPLSNSELKKAASTMAQFDVLNRARIAQAWPTATASDYNIILTNGTQSHFISDGQATAIDPGDTGISDALAQVHNNPRRYIQASHAGKNSVLIQPTKVDSQLTDTDIADAYETVMEESFRLYTQGMSHPEPSWPALTLTGNSHSSTPYPNKVAPRQLRHAIQFELAAAVNDLPGAADHLARAKYWYEQWATEYPQERERIRQFDIREGTAGYFGKTMTTSATGETYAARLSTPANFAQLTSTAVESKEIGAAALEIAHKMREPELERIQSGELTPLELLLEDVQPAHTATMPHTIVSALDNAIAEENATAGARIDPILQAHRSGKATYFSFPIGSFPTPYTTTDSYTLTNLSTAQHHAAALLGFTLGSPNITIKNTTVLQLDTQLLVPILPTDLTLNHDTLTVTSDHVTLIDAKVTQSTDAGGNTIYALAP